MKSIIAITLGILIVSMVVLLCFFSCFASKTADEYWEKLKKDLEKKDERG